MLARASGRGREFAVRSALGASRGRVMRQLLTESLLLGLAAGALGLIPAASGAKAALHALPAALPRADEIGLDWRVLTFTTVISVAHRACSSDWRRHGRFRKPIRRPRSRRVGAAQPGRNQRTLSVFVVVEVAVALVLLTGAGTDGAQPGAAVGCGPGFNPHNVVTFNIAMPPAMASATPWTMTRAKHRASNEALRRRPA